MTSPLPIIEESPTDSLNKRSTDPLKNVIKCVNALTGIIAADVSATRAKEAARAQFTLLDHKPNHQKSGSKVSVIHPHEATARIQMLTAATRVEASQVSSIRRKAARKMSMSVRDFFGMPNEEPEAAAVNMGASSSSRASFVSSSVSPAAEIDENDDGLDDGGGLLVPLNFGKLTENQQGLLPSKKTGYFVSTALRRFYSATVGRNNMSSAGGGGDEGDTPRSGGGDDTPPRPSPRSFNNTPTSEGSGGWSSSVTNLQDFAFGKKIAADPNSKNVDIDGITMKGEAEEPPPGQSKLYSRFSLKFFDAMRDERYFRDFFIKKSVLALRLSLVLGIAIMTAYTILAAPWVSIHVTTMRVLVICAGAALLGLTTLSAIKQSNVYITTMNCIALAISIFKALTTDSSDGLLGLVLFNLGTFLVMRLRFRDAVAIAFFDFSLWLITAHSYGYAAAVSGEVIFYLFLSFYCGLSYWKLNCAMHEDFLQEDRLSLEERRGGDLVNSMLPAHVIAALRGAGDSTNWSGRVNFEEKCVSVMFIQVVDFELVTIGYASEFVQLLDRLWGLIDAIAERHCVMKLETVGKEYVACCGLQADRLDHASALVSMAIDVLAAVAQLQLLVASSAPGAQRLAVRIGINTGRAVAGIVGATRPQFVLVGDTMNTASRVAAFGRESECNVSPTTYERLKHRFNFVSRVVDVKSKGKMTIRYVVGRIGDETSAPLLALKRASLTKYGSSVDGGASSSAFLLSATATANGLITVPISPITPQDSDASPPPPIFDSENQNAASTDSDSGGPPQHLAERLDFDEKGTRAVSKWTSAREAILRSMAQRRRHIDEREGSRERQRERALALWWPTLQFRDANLEARWNAGVHATHLPAARRAALCLLLYDVYRLLEFMIRFGDTRTRGHSTDVQALLRISQIFGLVIAIYASYTRWFSRPISTASPLHAYFVYFAAPILFFVLGLGFSFGVKMYDGDQVGFMDQFLFYAVASSVLPCPFATTINLIVMGVYIFKSNSTENLFGLLAAITIITFAKGTVDFYSRRRFGLASFMVDEVARNEKLLKYMLPEAMVEQLLTPSSAVGKRREPLTFHDVCILYCDVAGFTKLSATLEPHVLIETMNKMFTAFEQAAVKNGIFKVQTIGVSLL